MNLPAILGGETFKEWIKNRFGSHRLLREIPEVKIFAPDSAKLRKHVCRIFKAEEDVLFLSRRGRENLARDVAIYLQRKHCRQPLAGLGKDYGIANYSTVSSVCQRVKTRLQKDRKMQKILTKIETKLI